MTVPTAGGGSLCRHFLHRDVRDTRFRKALLMKNSCIVNWKHPFAVGSMAFMAVSLLARLVYYVPQGLTGFDWWVYLGIPVAATV